ncbi:MAG: M3 family metallopeptidase [Patescibacteria group bacterium]|mgnify:CR=1 FL=1
MEKPFLSLAIKNPRWFAQNTDAVLKTAEKELLVIAKLPSKEKRTVANVLEPFGRATAIIGEMQSKAHFFAAVHPDPKVRKAAERSVEKLSRFSSALYLRRDLYEAIKNVPEIDLDKETKRFRQKELLAFTLTGIEKPPSIRREIKKLMDKAVKLGQAFDRNIREDVRFLEFPAADLEGLPEDYRKAHKPDKKGMVRVSTQYPDYYPCMQYAVNGEARRKLSFLSNNRGWPKNERIFKDLLDTRRRQAVLIGYANWADYITADKMTGSAKVVRRFINELATVVKKTSERDFKLLLERKKKDQPNAVSLDVWDTAYYEDLAIKERIGLDTQEVRAYFSFERVERGILEITARLFGLSYRRVVLPTWHKEVKAFDVYRGKKLIGRIYFDLHPRKGKYGHAACFDLRPGIRGVQLPEASLVCNFSKGLMTHDEVTTFLHEFGHLLHWILGGDQRWARFNGFGTEWDFVEAPSQMLEAWALDYKTLKQFACHHKTRQPIPEALVKNMQKADKFGRGIWVRRQNFLSALSLQYHEERHPKRVDLYNIVQRVGKKYHVQQYPRGMYFYTSFGHLNGYSALYYTYIWSRAIAEDMLSVFRRKGMYDKKTARRYLEKVLAPGGSEDAHQLIRNFLGRDWDLGAFHAWIDK